MCEVRSSSTPGYGRLGNMGREAVSSLSRLLHILFLREEGGYLRTVADYPAYDLEIPPGWLPAIISGLQSSSENGSDLFERIVTVLIKAELESAGESVELCSARHG